MRKLLLVLLIVIGCLSVNVGNSNAESETVFCSISVERWRDLQRQTPDSPLYRISRITVFVPEGNSSCSYIYNLEHRFLSQTVIGNSSDCIYTDSTNPYKIECRGGLTGSETRVSMFHAEGFQVDDLVTLAVDVTNAIEEYFWFLGNMTLFLPSVSTTR